MRTFSAFCIALLISVHVFADSSNQHLLCRLRLPFLCDFFYADGLNTNTYPSLSPQIRLLVKRASSKPPGKMDSLFATALVTSKRHPDVYVAYANALEKRGEVPKASFHYSCAMERDIQHTDAAASFLRLSSLLSDAELALFRSMDSKLALLARLVGSSSLVALSRSLQDVVTRSVHAADILDADTAAQVLRFDTVRSLLVAERKPAFESIDIREIQECFSTKAAFEYTHKMAQTSTSTLSPDLIKGIHKRAYAYKPEEAGVFRTEEVVVGEYVPPSWEQIPALMGSLANFVANAERVKMHPIELAALVHWAIIMIQPFVDGNKRTAKLAMDFVLLKHKYPPALVKSAEKEEYLKSIFSARAVDGCGDTTLFVQFVAGMLAKTIDGYVRVMQPTAISDHAETAHAHATESEHVRVMQPTAISDHAETAHAHATESEHVRETRAMDTAAVASVLCSGHSKRITGSEPDMAPAADTCV